jgi:surfactin synthase thioesterase subunit
VVLDNAGVGDTAALTAPLTITEMADQTSDLIATLRLGRTAVPGWSMGGTIAQALALLHPAQVPGAKLLLYPEAGHAFLVQDLSTFLPAVQRFLGQTAS